MVEDRYTDDLFWKKSQEKIVEAAPPFDFLDSDSIENESFVTFDSYMTYTEIVCLGLVLP